MSRVLPRIPLYQASRYIGWPRLLPINLTLVPSLRCNSRCLTCRIWQGDTGNELTLTEWESILRDLGRAPFWVTISGGEPFLYAHLVELVCLIYRYCRPAVLNIPSNGLLTRTVTDSVRAVAASCPSTQFIVNLSLDGVGEDHDRIRGVPGNFGRFEETFHALRALDFQNLSVGIHTVLSRYNVHQVDRIFDYALGLAPDSYVTEIAEQRVELGTVGLDITPRADEYASAVARLQARLEGQAFRRVSRVTQAFRAEYYRLARRTLAEGRQVIPCYAGWASAQIQPDGEVWPCCVRAESIGNLRAAGYHFRRVWSDAAADRVRQTIRAGQCHCPLANAAYTNMLCHYPSLARAGWTLATRSGPPELALDSAE